MNSLNLFDSSALPSLANAPKTGPSTPSAQLADSDASAAAAVLPDYHDKYYSIIEEENRQKLKLQLEQEKERLKSLMPCINLKKDEYENSNAMAPITSATCNMASSSSNNSTTLKPTNNNNPALSLQMMPLTPNSQQQLILQSNPINSTLSNNYYLNDANKAFDDVVFDFLKVDPDYIAVSVCSF